MTVKEHCCLSLLAYIYDIVAVCVKTQLNTASASHIININMTAKFHTCHISYYICDGHVRGVYIHIGAMYIGTGSNHMTTSTIHILCQLHFILFKYITQQIQLPHCKYNSHCLHSVFACGSNTGGNVGQKRTKYINFINCCYIYARNKYTCEMLYIWWTCNRDICAYTCHI